MINENFYVEHTKLLSNGLSNIGRYEKKWTLSMMVL